MIGRGCAVGTFVAVALALAAPASGLPPLTTSTSVTPQPSFFGQQLTARIEVVVDSSVVDARTVRLTADFSPYQIVGDARRSSTSAGGVTAVGFVYRLSCLDDGCLPAAHVQPFRFRGGRVEAARRAGGAETVALHWPPVLVAPRVAAAAAAASPPAWRVQLALPPADYRVDPAAAITATEVAAGVLAALGIGLVAWEILRRLRIRRERERALSELALALQRVRESEHRSIDDRRRALALLSRVLAADGDGVARFADDVTRLAWARPEPSPERIDDLLTRIEREAERR